MAEKLVDSPKKPQQQTIADDLVLEIIARLPLKYAIQCSLLNKTFYHSISNPIFRRRLLSPPRTTAAAIVCCSGKILTKITPKTGGVSTTLPLGTEILASCNGVLLLHFRRDNSYYVFNPVTGGILTVNHSPSNIHAVGLVVDNDTKNSRFKLVTVSTEPRATLRTPNITLTFIVAAPSSGGAVVAECQEDFVSPTFIHPYTRPVYLNGCLHWLGYGGNNVIVFDVEKEEARVISGPVKSNEAGFCGFCEVYKLWFGYVDGSIQFVYSLRGEIAIHSYNYPKDEWEIKHKIPYNDSGFDSHTMALIPLFFDGRRLLVEIMSNNRRKEDHSSDYSLALLCDVSGNEWETVRAKFDDGRPLGQKLFFSFSPTFAKLSNKYVHKHKTGSPLKDSSFEVLQRLLMS